MKRIEITAFVDNPEVAAKKVIAALLDGDEAIITDLLDEEVSQAYEITVYNAWQECTGSIIGCPILGDDQGSSLLFSTE